jgi:ABC-type dipeptide/oligopeptide/nickel transport system permease subunit
MTGPIPVSAPAKGARRPFRGALLYVIAAVIVAGVLLAPLIAPHNPAALVGPARSAPSLAHWFGIDGLGRDVWSRTLFGGQQTLLMAGGSTLIAALIGVPLGIFAGYFGKIRGAITMRFMDVLLAFPGLLLALVIITVAGPGVLTTTVAVGISFIPVFAKVIYGTTQRVRAEEYIAAARVIGASSWRIMTRHILPVVLTEVLVLVSSAIGWTTLLCAGLSFLGFGVAPPTAEWGADLGAGAKYLAQAWWISAAPGLAITLTILIANFLGDYMAKVLHADPIAAPGAVPITLSSTNP